MQKCVVTLYLNLASMSAIVFASSCIVLLESLLLGRMKRRREHLENFRVDLEEGK